MHGHRFGGGPCGSGLAPLVCYPWLSPARVLDHGAKRGSSLRLFAAMRDLADKGFAPSGVLAAGRFRSEHSRMLQRQWLTYRPGVRPTVAATMNPNPAERVTSVGLGRRWADRTAFGPAGLASQTIPASAPFGAGHQSWAVCGAWRMADVGFRACLRCARRHLGSASLRVGRASGS